jgi:hypothetical protein
MVPFTIVTEPAGRSRGAHRSARAAAARLIGGSPAARHRGAIAKRCVGCASPLLLAQQAMLEDMPQGGLDCTVGTSHIAAGSVTTDGFFNPAISLAPDPSVDAS